MLEIEIGDYVVTPHGAIHWVVLEIASKIEPMGVLLESGMTGRKMYAAYSDLVLFRKANGDYR